jgi:hypothetical protein
MVPLQRAAPGVTTLQTAWATAVGVTSMELLMGLKSSQKKPEREGCVLLIILANSVLVRGSWCVGSWVGDG